MDTLILGFLILKKRKKNCCLGQSPVCLLYQYMSPQSIDCLFDFRPSYLCSKIISTSILPNIWYKLCSCQLLALDNAFTNGKTSKPSTSVSSLIDLSDMIEILLKAANNLNNQTNLWQSLPMWLQTEVVLACPLAPSRAPAPSLSPWPCTRWGPVRMRGRARADPTCASSYPTRITQQHR